MFDSLPLFLFIVGYSYPLLLPSSHTTDIGHCAAVHCTFHVVNFFSHFFRFKFNGRLNVRNENLNDTLSQSCKKVLFCKIMRHETILRLSGVSRMHSFLNLPRKCEIKRLRTHRQFAMYSPLPIDDDKFLCAYYIRKTEKRDGIVSPRSRTERKIIMCGKLDIVDASSIVMWCVRQCIMDKWKKKFDTTKFNTENW